MHPLGLALVSRAGAQKLVGKSHAPVGSTVTTYARQRTLSIRLGQFALTVAILMGLRSVFALALRAGTARHLFGIGCLVLRVGLQRVVVLLPAVSCVGFLKA